MAIVANEYRVWSDIKVRMKAAGVTVRDLVPILNEAPSTIGARLNGYIKFPDELREKVAAFLTSREAKG